LPEIIGFSNKYVYNNDIIPLKTATEYKYGNPIEMYYVEDEIEDDEKPNIIKKSIEIIESYVNSYIKGEIGQIPTIGIITLDSSNTRHQQGLIRKIANSELIKMHEDKLELLIGTSREFQGDEKDIIILTTTTSHSINDKFELKPPKAIMSEEYSRIYNVASSRAKEKSILLHSIRSEAVAMMNPDCYRKRLIDYYTESQTGIVKFESRRLDELLKLVDANSGGFERTVCTSLYNQGFADNIHPQFKVGKYKIDFAIIKNNKKLAIECDGVKYHSGFEKIREDISRQIVLERAGWKFFRIQSTEWFYKNEYISRKLFNWLNESIQN
jgi:very-short-patch-repair endonuclease